MRQYSASVNIAGDRNHVVTKAPVTAAEIMVLQAIHGAGEVHHISAVPGSETDKTPHAVERERLERRYGRTRVGPDSDKRPVLVRVFPGWPNVELPADVKAANLPSTLMVEKEHAPSRASHDTPTPVKQRTWWRVGDELGVAEKGDVLPMGAEKITKADYEATLAAQDGGDGEGNGDEDDNFTE